MFGKVVHETVVRNLCRAFQKLIKIVFRNLDLVIALQITKFLFLFTKTLYLLCFFVILHKFVTSTVTFTKYIYLKLLIQQLRCLFAFICWNPSILNFTHYLPS